MWWHLLASDFYYVSSKPFKCCPLQALVVLTLHIVQTSPLNVSGLGPLLTSTFHFIYFNLLSDLLALCLVYLPSG